MNTFREWQKREKNFGGNGANKRGVKLKPRNVNELEGR